jgi:Xaa-Pro dipeptidase
MNSVTLRLPSTPLAPAPDVPSDELQTRLAKIRKQMDLDGLDAIVLSDKKNIQYFTDFFTLSWAYKARPVFAVITANSLVLIGSLAEAKNVKLKSRVFTAEYYDGYMVEAVTLISDTIKKACKGAVRVGIDYGQDMMGVASLELIDALGKVAASGKVQSAVKTLWRVRLIKSPFEAELKRTAFAIVNEAFDLAIADARLGMPEFELYQRMQAQIFLNGAESGDQIAMLFSKGDFAYGRPPSTRKLEPGHYVWTDFRATYGGYPADRNRTARAGEPEQWERETYTVMRNLTHGLCRSVRAGMTCADVYANFEKMWVEMKPGKLYGAVSRIGHGGGMDVTEPPSLSRTDQEVIRPGMILHIEPKLEHDGAVFQFEEVIYVREEGVDFLSALSPAKIPVIL